MLKRKMLVGGMILSLFAGSVLTISYAQQGNSCNQVDKSLCVPSALKLQTESSLKVWMHMPLKLNADGQNTPQKLQQLVSMANTQSAATGISATIGSDKTTVQIVVKKIGGRAPADIRSVVMARAALANVMLDQPSLFAHDTQLYSDIIFLKKSYDPIVARWQGLSGNALNVETQAYLNRLKDLNQQQVPTENVYTVKFV